MALLYQFHFYHQSSYSAKQTDRVRTCLGRPLIGEIKTAGLILVP